MQLIKPLLLSLFFSSFIYFEYFEISLKLINTIFALAGLLLIFYLNKKEMFWGGFFIGIFWFWWISLSFIYYELEYLIPVVILGIGLCYGTIFFLIGISQNYYIKFALLFLLSFIEPFGFNWFKPELLFIESYLGTSKIEYFLILLCSLLLVKYYKNKYIILLYGISLILLSIYNKTNKEVFTAPPLNIYTYNTFIPQEQKWKKPYREKIVSDNIKAIENAIEKKYDIIILPETSFPLVLNREFNLLKALLNYSADIAIVVGSIYKKENQFYNSTYLFDNGTYQIANKVVLVPFGEAVPLPQKIRDFINEQFYNGAKDYQVAKEPTTFNIKDTKFRNAICYEATTDTIFQNLDTKYMIAISNNAWFTPSIQPTLQKLLMKYFSQKYKVYVLSVSNS